MGYSRVHHREAEPEFRWHTFWDRHVEPGGAEIGFVVTIAELVFIDSLGRKDRTARAAAQDITIIALNKSVKNPLIRTPANELVPTICPKRFATC